MKVLVVDDESAWREDVSDIVGIAGHKPRIARSGRQAEELLINGEFDAVITDVRMSDGNGIELCQFIWSWFPKNPPPVYVHSSEPKMEFSDRLWNLEHDIKEFFGEFAEFHSKKRGWIGEVNTFLASIEA